MAHKVGPISRNHDQTEPSKEGGDSPQGSSQSSDVNEDYPKGWKLFLIILPLCLGTLLVAIDNTIIAVAIPKISSTFKALDQAAWYGSGYLLTVTAFQPTYGKIYKYFNVKFVYLASIALFEVGSVLCAAAPNSPIFILGRVVSGAGAAGLFQGALCIVGLSVSLNKRPLFLGIVVSAFGLATCFGPILGGALTSDASWRWCFWINLPIGVVDFLLVFVFFRLHNAGNEDRSKSFREKRAHLDPWGAVTLIAAVCCLLLALQWGGTKYSWDNARIVCLFALLGLLLIAFCLLQWKLGEKGTIPPRILRQRTVLVGCLYTFMLSMANYTDGYYIPFYFQAAQGVSAAQSGIRFVPLAFPEVFAILLTGVIINKTGYYVPLMILGSIVGIIGTALLTTIKTGTPTVEWATYLVLSGIGIGLGINIPYTALQVVLDESDIDIGNAVTVFFTQLGGYRLSKNWLSMAWTKLMARATALPIANSVFIHGLQETISKQKTAVSPQAAIEAGATNLRALTGDSGELHALQMSYVIAVKNSLYFVLAAISSTLLIGICMEWKRMGVAMRKAGEARAAVEDDFHPAGSAKENAVLEPAQ